MLGYDTHTDNYGIMRHQPKKDLNSNIHSINLIVNLYIVHKTALAISGNFELRSTILRYRSNSFITTEGFMKQKVRT
jgi:hypothetical protein